MTTLLAVNIAKLDLGAATETKGIQIVGNYGTGKSHLMSLFSIIAENADYLDMVQSSKAKDWLKTIAGKPVGGIKKPPEN